jgi:hypothetical protein
MEGKSGASKIFYFIDSQIKEDLNIDYFVLLLFLGSRGNVSIYMIDLFIVL